jgi:hypothetical protein
MATRTSLNNKRKIIMKIVFCLPGNGFSGRFLDGWSELVAYCLTQGIQILISRKESCNIYYVRNMCLGADTLRGKNQKPFDNKIDYDYLMWIDSDMVFAPAQFQRLLNHQKDIVAGIYSMADGKEFATVPEWDEEYFKANGCFKFLNKAEIEGKNELFKVSYTGMGFMLVKKGVFEAMEYPWFKPLEKQIGDMVDFTMEDVSFCLRAKESGFDIWVDPAIIVGHEKKIVI